jgi:hypothetical protein
MATINERLQVFYESLDDDDRAALDVFDPEASTEDMKPSLRRRLAELAGQFSDDEKVKIAAALDNDVEGFTDYSFHPGYGVRDHRPGAVGVAAGGSPEGGVTVTPINQWVEVLRPDGQWVEVLRGGRR